MTAGYLALAVAVLAEVAGTLSLRMAALGRPRWYVAVVVGYVIAFGMLSVTLAAGIPLGIAYGIWSATGVALTALLGRVLFRDPLNGVMLGGLGLIMAGVLLVELGSSH